MEDIFIEIAEQRYVFASYSKPKGLAKGVAAKRLILMIHGFPSAECSRQSLFSDAQAVSDRLNLPCLKFDFSNCGKSDGQDQGFRLSTARRDVQSIFLWAQKEGYQDFGIIAEGLGATVALMNASAPIRFFILAWPALDMRLMMENYFMVLQNKEFLEQNGYILCDGQRVGKDLLDEMLDINVEGHLSTINVPTLVLHGAKDQRIPMAHLDVIREHMASKRIDITSFQDGEHRLPDPRHRSACITHMKIFLERYALV